MPESGWVRWPPSSALRLACARRASISGAAPATPTICDALDSAVLGPPQKKLVPPPIRVDSAVLGKPPVAPYLTERKLEVVVQEGSAPAA